MALFLTMPMKIVKAIIWIMIKKIKRWPHDIAYGSGNMILLPYWIEISSKVFVYD